VSGYTVVNNNDQIQKHIGAYTVRIARIPRDQVDSKDLLEFFKKKYGEDKIIGFFH
jgi:hypothetical protein